MEGILAQLSEGLVVDAAAGSDTSSDLVQRQALYKNQSRLEENQHLRRSKLLERQKQERDDRLDRLRALTSDDGADGEDGEGMDTTVPSAFRYKKKEYYHSRYSNQLMFSEWMEEKPEDLEDSWLLKMCPKGKRCLVVAKRETTRSYAASGAPLRWFPSLLPAGCRAAAEQRPTVLDCLWDEAALTFHVLDVLCWNGHDVFECDTDFRFAWLLSKLSESPELGRPSRRNPYRFSAIAAHACSPAALAAAAAEAGGAADGALFFHRAAHYCAGPTPLVLWLKPFMLPEAVGVPLTAAELGAPDDYAGRADFVARFEERRRAGQQRRRSKRQEKMES